MNIYTEVEGSGKDIVLLHGWGCNHHHMRPLVEHLSDRFRVTNVNLPGCGESDWQDIKTMHDIADHILPVLPPSAIYIGHSFGGMVAASIAARYPERITHFIGIATTPKFIADESWSGVPQPGFKSGFNVNNMHEFKALMRSMTEAEFEPINPKPPAYQEYMDIIDTKLERSIAPLLQGIDIIDATDFREEYQKINCKIDLILGGKDACVPQDAYSNIRKINPNITLHVVDDAQHLVFATHPTPFYEILDKLLIEET